MCNSGYFLSYVEGLGTSYARSFLASTNARFYKELDREMLNNFDTNDSDMNFILLQRRFDASYIIFKLQVRTIRITFTFN